MQDILVPEYQTQGFWHHFNYKSHKLEAVNKDLLKKFIGNYVVKGTYIY